MDISLLLNNINTNWKDILINIEYTHINDYLNKCIDYNLVIYPYIDDIFKCFTYFNFEETRIVLLGQDPYIKKDQAMGLCFSVKNEIKTPPSLKNMFNELYDDTNIERINSDLTDWAEQKILLLNTALTVIDGKSNSHKKIWENFTDQVIKIISEKCDNIIFILLGNYAKNKKKLININKHYIIESGHPSPLSVRHFYKCKCFSKCNDYLINNGFHPIKW
jgi:uracil-DNA glycosylase